MRKEFKFFRQLDYMDCGPTCLQMVAAYYGRNYSLDHLRTLCGVTKNGVSFLGLTEAADKIGMKTEGLKITADQLVQRFREPCILHWKMKHFVVLYKIDTGSRTVFGKRKIRFLIGDPAHGRVWVNESIFFAAWLPKDSKGLVLLAKPGPAFHEMEGNTIVRENSGGIKFLRMYIKPYKKYILQIFLGMAVSSVLSLILPFLTQSLVDEGIKKRNIEFIYLILLSQLLLFIGGVIIDIIRNWILLHINIRVSVKIISNFLEKLMNLPIRYFESKNVGDITQRIYDHDKIENFLTGSTLSTFFSLINLVVFSIVLGIYNLKILGAFLIGSIFSAGWVMLFLKKRRTLNYGRFQYMRESQNKIFEMINGMSEIKLNNCEASKRNGWEKIQLSLFKLSAKSLALEQLQEIGFYIFSQLKNIMISFLAAMAVVNNTITLGMMLSISFIVGQLNGPLLQLINFVRNIQDARISFLRLSEIHERPDEEEKNTLVAAANTAAGDGYNGILLKGVSFRYGGRTSPEVLDNITLHIPHGKITAVVGSSGSGKTTLLKLLLKFYDPVEGKILVNGTDLKDLSAREWRRLCGTVMQDGYLFSDTIANNVIMDTSDENTDKVKLQNSLKVANISDFVEGLTSKSLTETGTAGVSLSGGQKQRLLISRAVYKNPKYLFFDEATNELDSNNERIIMNNLNQFFKGRTVLVIAHRLSTVRNADQIVVLEAGRIVEIGPHETLVAQKGRYYDLVKNQLDLEILENQLGNEK